jgi:hypothetical protein
MTRKHWENRPISAKEFMRELRRLEKGSVSRRHFLAVTGLATATATLAGGCRGSSRGAPLPPACQAPSI